MIHYVTTRFEWALQIASVGSIVALVCLSSAKARDKPDREMKDFLGPVKSVRTEVARFTRQRGTWVETQRVTLNISSYDTTGKLTDTVFYSPDGSVIRKHFNRYDEHGRLAEYTINDSGGSLSLPSRKHVNTYDNKGRIIEFDEYSPDGALVLKSVQRYDEQNTKSDSTIYNPDGSIGSKMTTVYDEVGRAIEAAYYDSNGALRERSVYTYVPERGRIETTRYNGDDTVSDRTVSAYDEKGNLVEESHFKVNGALEGKSIYTYDFDSTGNWIKRTASELITRSGKSYFEPTQVTYRVITYY